VFTLTTGFEAYCGHDNLSAGFQQLRLGKKRAPVKM